MGVSKFQLISDESGFFLQHKKGITRLTKDEFDLINDFLKMKESFRKEVQAAHYGVSK